MDNKKTLMFFGRPANDADQNGGGSSQHGSVSDSAVSSGAVIPSQRAAEQRLPQPRGTPGRVGGQSALPIPGNFQPGRVSGQPQPTPNPSFGMADGGLATYQQGAGQGSGGQGASGPSNGTSAGPPPGFPNHSAEQSARPNNPSARPNNPNQPWNGNLGPGGQQGGQAWGNQSGFNSNSGQNFMGNGNPLGNMTKGKIIGSVVAAIVVAIVSVVGLTLKNKYGGGKAGKQTITYSRLGIDKTKANVDEVIDSLGGFAAKWKKDASWLALNVHRVRPDATVDLSKGSAVVKFVSASRVRSKAKSVRKDSIKEYSFGPKGARSTKMIGAKKPWENFEAFALPQCKVSSVVATLNERGFNSGTVRISFNPTFNTGWNWRVYSKNKELEGFYSMADCSYSKKPR